jgi:hypothetical protein
MNLYGQKSRQPASGNHVGNAGSRRHAFALVITPGRSLAIWNANCDTSARSSLSLPVIAFVTSPPAVCAEATPVGPKPLDAGQIVKDLVNDSLSMR